MMPAPDSRFSRLQTDPRFRRPKQKALKVEIDDRFRDVLESEEFGGKGKGKGKAHTGKARVDKRGRPLAATHHSDQLKHFYRLRSASPEQQPSFVDYARGEGNLVSSGSEDENDGDGQEDEDESEVDEEELELGGKRSLRARLELSDSESSSESSDEDHLQVDLSEGPFETSVFPPEDDDEAEEDQEEEESVPPTSRLAVVNLDWDNLRAGDLYTIFNSFLRVGPRRSGDKTTSTSPPVIGKLLHVRIYPSEFGKERMAKEDEQGPGGGIFISKPGDKSTTKGKKRTEEIMLADIEEGEEDQHSDEDDDGNEEEEEEEDEDAENLEEAFQKADTESLYDEGEDEDENQEDGISDDDAEALEIISDVDSDAGSDDIDMDMLRQYQLERLRYYYAIATFSSVDAAQLVHNELDGTEFERTANVIDLSYVPEDMTFADDEIKDEATKEPKAYKGNEFVTDALRHSKVKLTWDQDDPNRSKITRRALTREEIEENDFKAYVASSESEGDDEDEEEAADPASIPSLPVTEGIKAKSKKQRMKERTEKLRALLLSGADDDTGDIWGKSGSAWQDELVDKGSKNGKGGKSAGDDMEITFRPGLSVAKATNPDENEENLTSLERYQRRMKEKKERKKEQIELRRAEKEIKDSDSTEKPALVTSSKDDFFGDSDDSDEPDEPERDISHNQAAKRIRDKNEDDDTLVEDSTLHFSMKDVVASEKEGAKKRKRVRKSKSRKLAEAEAAGGTREVELGPDGWKVDVKDERFAALHSEPEFAIDPSNPKFTKTKAMQDLLAERSRVRNAKVEGTKRHAVSDETRKPGAMAESATSSGADLSALVQRVKGKMDQNVHRGRKRARK